MRCTDTSAAAALEALFLGTLEAAAAARLRAHCQGCASCRDTYDRLARVESVLERRALSRHREALLEKALFSRLGSVELPPEAEPVVAPARPAPPPRRVRWALPAWVRVAAPLGACAALALGVLVRQPAGGEAADGWRARAGGTASAWGVRAFCVSPAGQVVAEARPGETLTCAPGAVVQFSYTAPTPAQLTLVARSPSGGPLFFLPGEGGSAPVAAGVDVPLDFSTPVDASWLSGRLEVKARFTDARGRVLGETRLTLTP